MRHFDSAAEGTTKGDKMQSIIKSVKYIETEQNGFSWRTYIHILYGYIILVLHITMYEDP